MFLFLLLLVLAAANDVIFVFVLVFRVPVIVTTAAEGPIARFEL